MLIVKDGKTFKIELESRENGEKKPGIGNEFFGYEYKFKITCTPPEEDPLFLNYYTMKMEQRIRLAGEDEEYIRNIPYSPFEEDEYEKALAVKLWEQGCEVTVKQKKHVYKYDPNVFY